MKARGALLALPFALVACTPAGDGAAWISGHVADAASRPIEGAQVYFEVCTGPGIPNVTTGATGEFRASCMMAPGRYQTAFVIDAPGYKPARVLVPTLTDNWITVELAFLSSAANSRASLGTAPRPSPAHSPGP